MRGAGGGRRGRGARRAAGALLAAAVVLLSAACGTSDLEPTAVPTFSAAADTGPASTAADDGRVIPADCGRILATSDLEAVMGLPLGSVAVRTTIGVAQPAVSRTERVSCRYTRVGENRGPLLDINASAYIDAAAASKQWKVNVEAESGERRDMSLGTAPAALFEKQGKAALMLAHSTSNLTLVLPDQPLPGDKTRADALVDLALRVLPSVSIVPSSTAPPAQAPHTGPVSQAGAAR
ncbi:hypothetical protein [Pseudonocardia zijingensis]|uniref:hypothetical protein n=1 Tax=Pseudonocardia zijingensis TaxID=153376 RepID=UPI0036203F87